MLKKPPPLPEPFFAEPPVRVVLIDGRTIVPLHDILVTASSVVYDFETNRLPWWHKDHKALTVSFTVSPGKAFVVPLYHPESSLTDFDIKFLFSTIRERMQSPEQKHTAHQGVFDDLVWFRIAGYRPYLTLDTMALAHALDENRPRGLKYLGRALLGWPDWGIDTRDLANDPLEQVAFYNGCDTAATWLLRDRLLADLKQDYRLQGYVAGVLMPGLRAVEGIVERGIFVNRARLDQQTDRLTKERDAAAAEIPVENPNSTKQIGTWLYETLGLKIPKRTPTGAPCTDEETIHRLALQHPSVRTLLDYRKPQKMLSAYMAPIAAKIEVSIDGRLHEDVKIGPKTGRFASRFHTTPRDADIRSVFSAPEGSVLLSCDYRQIEARLVAWAAAGRPSVHEYSGKLHGQNFLDAFMDPKRDVYIEMAASVLNKPLSAVTTGKPGEPSNDRQIMGKVPTLAMLYKISPDGLRNYAWSEYQIEWTAAQARKIHNTFYLLWPEVRDWQEREVLVVSTRGWNQSALGRKIRLPDALTYSPKQHEAIGTGINMPIQSLASDITLTAARLFQADLTPTLEKSGYLMHHLSRTFLVGFVHDALLVETNVDAAPLIAKTLQECMLTAPAWLRRFGLDLPEGLIQVELTAGPWGSKTTFEQWRAQHPYKPSVFGGIVVVDQFLSLTPQTT